VTIGKPMGCIPQQTPDQGFIPRSLDVRHHKLAHGVNDFRFPLWLAFILGIPMPFVRLQSNHFQILHAFVVKGLSMVADLAIQPPNHARMHFRQPHRRFQRTTLR
jgi:hypothetical protein